jgi:hypothetical protein
MATRVVTVNEILDGHAGLDLACFDRIYRRRAADLPWALREGMILRRLDTFGAATTIQRPWPLTDGHNGPDLSPLRPRPRQPPGDLVRHRPTSFAFLVRTAPRPAPGSIGRDPGFRRGSCAIRPGRRSRVAKDLLAHLDQAAGPAAGLGGGDERPDLLAVGVVLGQKLRGVTNIGKSGRVGVPVQIQPGGEDIRTQHAAARAVRLGDGGADRIRRGRIGLTDFVGRNERAIPASGRSPCEPAPTPRVAPWPPSYRRRSTAGPRAGGPSAVAGRRRRRPAASAPAGSAA